MSNGSTQKIKIAVVSDLHCHPIEHDPKASFLLSDGPRSPKENHPIAALCELIKAKAIECDILALPGEYFTDKANHHGFVVGLFNAREIGAKLKAKTVVACLGNHDVDSRLQFSSDPFYLGRKLFLDFPVECAEQHRNFYSSGFAIEEGECWRCLIVNSVLHHTDSETAKRGLLTVEQLNEIDGHLKGLSAKSIKFCLFHHHPIPHEEMGLGAHDLMEGGERLLQILERERFALAIHGHKHHPRLRYSNGGNAAIPVFAAGSLSAIISDRLSRSVRNTFHLVEVEAENNNIKNHMEPS